MRSDLLWRFVVGREGVRVSPTPYYHVCDVRKGRRREEFDPRGSPYSGGYRQGGSFSSTV